VGGKGGSSTGGTTSGTVVECATKTFPADASCTTNNFTTKTADSINWAEAMQKALWFFSVNKSGPGVTCGDVEWRGNSHLDDTKIKLISGDPNGVDLSAAYINAHRTALDPDGNGTVDLSGGLYDAGHYVRFGLPTAYAATMVAWSMYEFPEAFGQTRLKPEGMALLRWFADYFIRSTFLENGEVIAFAHQVGDVTDHECGWMPPELRLSSFCPRKAYFATHEKPAADVVAATAAALALTAAVYNASGTDADFAALCLERAKALYRFARLYPKSIADTSDGLYSGEYASDKLAWAALWLGIVTGDNRYFDHLVGDLRLWQDPAVWSQGYFSQYPGYANPDEGWFESYTYVWRAARPAVFTKFAEVLRRMSQGLAAGHPATMLANKMATIARDDALGWVDSINVSPGGFTLKFLDTWGSGRYNSAGQFLALMYAKAFPDDARAQDMKNWAQRQAKYLLGGNPRGVSYMNGFTTKYSTQPHHASAHASVTGTVEEPSANRHVLWGALVNGPTDLNDSPPVGERGDFAANEVTIDYNAAFLAALTANYATLGSTHCPIPNFPPRETRIDEFYTTSTAPTTNSCVSQVTLTMVNESIHPPRYDETLTARFYINVSELIAAGVSPSTLSVRKAVDTAGIVTGTTTVVGPLRCPANSNLWYVELGFAGAKFWGEISALTAPRTVTLEYGTGTGGNCVWNPSNDYSTETLSGAVPVKNPHVTVYSQGKLVYGEEPTCL
jgi:hypothetical protein